MDKFWEWVIENNYGMLYEILRDGSARFALYSTQLKTDSTCEKYTFFPTKQMLIGYMMEYLDEFYTYGTSWIFDFAKQTRGNTKSRYNWLESKINELEAKR